MVDKFVSYEIQRNNENFEGKKIGQNKCNYFAPWKEDLHKICPKVTV
jgi:hypothetical protein